MTQSMTILLLDDFMQYCAEAMEHWDKDDFSKRTIGQALVDAEAAIVPSMPSLFDGEEPADSKELRRYLTEMLVGAASMRMLLAAVPDSTRKPARLTIITLTNQWRDRVKDYPVLRD
ncbi:MAG: hypothetical protein WBP22_03775 [Candidatus Saccharimonas sp.]